MASFGNAFALLDSDEEDQTVIKKVDKKVEKQKKKPSKPKPSNAVKENKLNGNATNNAPVAAGSGWDDNPKQDGVQKRRTDGRRGGRGGRGGYMGRNGREFDRRSGTGRGREMKKGGAGGHNWGQADDITANTNDAEETPATTEAPAEGQAPAEPEVEQPPPEPEVVHLSLEEYEAQKAAKAEELAEHEFFEERDELAVDEDEFEGLTIKEAQEEEDDDILLGGNEAKGKKGKKKKSSGRAKQLVTDVGFRPPPIERGGRGGRGRGDRGPRRDYGGRGGGAGAPAQNTAELDINAFPSLS
mmetsp:Transcript_31048/g.38939  ORF Transcript_31048/g.38939 Transcript_31048/m.38939 type:complete len:300 (+) Transcript_31048:210-1109(+)